LPLTLLKKYGQLLLLLISWSTLSGNNCDLPEIDASYERLYKSIDAAKAVYALELADSLIQVVENMGKEDCPIYLWIQYEKGEALEFLNKPEEALSLYYNVVRKAEAIEAWELVAEAYISIARAHEPIGRPDDCLRNLMNALKIIEAHDLEATFSRFAVRYASYHRIYGNKDSARIYATKAIGYGRKHKVLRSELDGHLLMGMLIDDLDQSVFHFQEAVKIDLERKSFYGAAFQQLNIARQYYKAGLIEKATTAVNLAYDYAGKMSETYPNYHRVYQYLHKFKYQLFDNQGMKDSALHYFVKSADSERLASSRVNQEEINQKEIAFAIEQEQAKLQFEQQRSFYLRWGLVLVVILLAGMILAFINNVQKKRYIAHQKDLISQKNQELKVALQKHSTLLSEVHHRVKNNLQLVMSLLTLKGSKLPEEDIQIHFDDLASKVHSIALIHQQLYQAGEFDEVNLDSYLRDLTTHFKGLQSDDESFQINLETEELHLNLETVMPLGMICSELISNSLKYGRVPDQQLILDISVHRETENYIFTYKDNGPGYPHNKLEHTPNSMGGLLIKSMVRQLRATCETSNDHGALFEMKFREKEISQV
jgi:two-component sensor histidine kinase